MHYVLDVRGHGKGTTSIVAVQQSYRLIVLPAVNEAEQQDHQYHQADDRVEAVLLQQEAGQREDDADNGRGDQQKDAHLDDAQVRAACDSGEGAADAERFLRGRVEVGVVRRRTARMPKIKHAAGEHDQGRYRNADAQHVSDDRFKALVGFAPLSCPAWRV